MKALTLQSYSDMEVNQKQTIFNIKGNLVTLDFPCVMGIVNLSPDSFFEESRAVDLQEIHQKIEKHLAQGASIIDIGTASSKPGSAIIDAEEEQKRLAPFLQMMQHRYNQVLFSIDTYHSSTAAMAVANGFSMINDISAGEIDAELPLVAIENRVPYILMHMQGKPENMQKNPVYENTVQEVLLFLQKKIQQFRQMGMHDIIVDPGFGFGKSVEHNFELLRHLSQFRLLDCPLLVGLSRKAMINKSLGIQASEALNGTTVLNTVALQNGADILRVHDVKEAFQCIRLLDKVEQKKQV
jgi:dihydropteroate synthase